MTHDELVLRAREAVRAVHDDTSVPREAIGFSLDTIRHETQLLAASVRRDLEGDVVVTLGDDDMEAEGLT